MPGSRYHRRLSALRWGLLGAAMLTALIVAGLYWLGRAAKPEEEAEVPAADRGNSRLVSSGFDYTVSQEDRPLFRIRGATVRSDADGQVNLDGVGLTLFRANGEVYELSGDKALYDRGTNGARISGATRLVGPSGIVLETEALELEPGGRRVRSDAPVRFSLAENYRGQAERLDADLRSETFLFAGGVQLVGEVEGSPKLALTAKRLLIDRSTGTIHAESDVRLSRGRDLLEARRVSVQLSDDQRQVAFVRARWEVLGRFHVGGGEAPASGDAPSTEIERVRVRGTGLSLSLRGGRPDRLELEGPPRRPARLLGLAADGGETSVEGSFIVGRFADGELVSAEATGEVEILKRPAADAEPTHRGTSRRAEATMLRGELVAASLHGDVRLLQPGFVGEGDVAFLDLRSSRAELQGAPARVETDRGELEAPKITYRRGEGLLQAGEGARVVMRQQDSAAIPLAGSASGDEPLRVEARQATFVEAQRSFAFIGQVRAWRGDDLLLADELRGDETTGTVSARGSVRTVWRPLAEERAAEAAADPVEVVADSLLYRRAAGVAIFTGHVEARQSGRLLRCAEATLELDAANELRRLVCEGDAVVEEPALRRRVTGKTATYDVTGRSVVIVGDPVLLDDPLRGKAKGRAVHYDLSTGHVRLSAREEQAAPPPDGSR